MQIIMGNFDAIISSQNCCLKCCHMVMLTTQCKADLNHLDGLDMRIPRISNCETPRVEGPRSLL